jgi:hypothetical protein
LMVSAIGSFMWISHRSFLEDPFSFFDVVCQTLIR